MGPMEMLVPLTSSSIPSRAVAASCKLIIPVSWYHFRLSREALWGYSLERKSRKGTRKKKGKRRKEEGGGERRRKGRGEIEGGMKKEAE